MMDISGEFIWGINGGFYGGDLHDGYFMDL